MDIKEELLSKIKINENECWEWQGTKSRKYGVMRVDGKLKGAHRISYNIFKGEIPLRMLICHHCDNPSCINPQHLFLGTYKDNYDDYKKKSRLRLGQNKDKPSKTQLGKIIRVKRALARKKTVREIALLTSINMTEQEIIDIRDKKIFADIGSSIIY